MSEGQILCKRCGCKRDSHRAKDLKCPKVIFWGGPIPEPKHTDYVKPGMSLEENHAAYERFDRALDAFYAVVWSGPEQYYQAVDHRPIR